MTVIIVILLMIVLAMVGLILLQKSEGGGLGMGGGGGAGFLSSRGTANVLTRTTAILAALYFGLSLFLSWYAGIARKPRSILDTAPPPGPSAPAVPSTPNTPLGGPGGGVLNQLGGPQPQPAAPGPAAPQPAPPQVPQSK